MCCFLPVHSWHSSLPFSFFDCDFFFSLALIVKPRVRSQPSPTAPVWLSHRKLGFLYSLLSHFLCPSLFLLVCFSVSRCLFCFSPCILLYFFFFCVCLSASVNLPLCLNFMSLVLFYRIETRTQSTQHNTHTTLSISRPVSLSQPADWFSRRGSAGLHKHMALNLPSCVCWNGISFSVMFVFSTSVSLYFMGMFKRLYFLDTYG